MIDPTQIAEHMEVVGSDGVHVGTVDKLVLKLTKKDPAAKGQHHVINLDLIAGLEDGKVKLSIPSADAMEQEKAIQG